jgi:hypothetical protein
MNFGLILTFVEASWLFVGNYWHFAKRLELITQEKNYFHQERCIKLTIAGVSILILLMCLFYLWANLFYIH